MASAPQPALDFSALLAAAIAWRQTTNPEVPWQAEFNGNSLALRLNDFPDEPLYTLLVNDNPLGDFDDWPAAWMRAV